MAVLPIQSDRSILDHATAFAGPSEDASYRPVSHGRDARATMASWHGRPGHDTNLTDL